MFKTYLILHASNDFKNSGGTGMDNWGDILERLRLGGWPDICWGTAATAGRRAGRGRNGWTAPTTTWVWRSTSRSRPCRSASSRRRERWGGRGRGPPGDGSKGGKVTPILFTRGCRPPLSNVLNYSGANCAVSRRGTSAVDKNCAVCLHFCNF